jgi:hypothetical protein
MPQQETDAPSDDGRRVGAMPKGKPWEEPVAHSMTDSAPDWGWQAARGRRSPIADWSRPFPYADPARTENPHKMNDLLDRRRRDVTLTLRLSREKRTLQCDFQQIGSRRAVYQTRKGVCGCVNQS